MVDGDAIGGGLGIERVRLMAHFVLVKQKGAAEGRFLFGDLDLAALKRRFLKPYDRGKKIVEGNAVVDLAELDAVQIVRTEKSKHETIDQVMIGFFRTSAPAKAAGGEGPARQ